MRPSTYLSDDYDINALYLEIKTVEKGYKCKNNRNSLI